jgi:hypothetical protein
MPTRRRAKNGAKKRKAKGVAGLSASAAIAVATSPKKPTKTRLAAMAKVAPVICEDDQKFEALLKVLRDRKEPISVRLAALQAIQAASFAVVQFESCRGNYLAALRSVATDPDPELRQRVLGLLAREKDGFAQELLLKGLEQPAKAVVPPEKALQLLSYDVHTDAYPVARAIVENPPNDAAKAEALRLLAADTASKSLFEEILRDKDETKEARQIAATALQTIAPNEFQTLAKEILLDSKDYDDIQATSLTALTHFGNAEELEKDRRIIDRVSSFKKKASSAKLKRGALQFLTKYRQ